MDRVGPTNPYHISKAYGLTSAPRTNAATSSAGAAANTGPFSIAKTSPARPVRTDSVDASTTKAAAAKARISTLVAAKVAPSPETSMGQASGAAMMPKAASSAGTNSAAFPMYRHPADKNAAATAVNAGKILDLNA